MIHGRQLPAKSAVALYLQGDVIAVVVPHARAGTMPQAHIWKKRRLRGSIRILVAEIIPPFAQILLRDQAIESRGFKLRSRFLDLLANQASFVYEFKSRRDRDCIYRR